VGVRGRTHAPPMDGRWLALAAAALLGAPGVARAQEPADKLGVPAATADRVEFSALVFRKDSKPRLLVTNLTISGIDPRDVQRTLQAYNRRSEIANVSGDSVAIGPYVLQRALQMPPEQLLQLRVSSQSAKLVFRMTWR
jgi:hypothetical protein